MTTKVHHNNCTYCVHRGSKPTVVKNGKALKKAGKKEICMLTGNELVPVFAEKGIRWCEKYSQRDCNCAICAQNAMETVDKRAKIWYDYA